MVKKEVTLKNPQGMHMRPAGVLSGIAAKYPCEITIHAGDKSANAKSIMLIMAAGIKGGSVLTVECSGDKENEALDAVCAAIEEGLGE